MNQVLLSKLKVSYLEDNQYTLADKEMDASYLMCAYNEFFMIYKKKPDLLNKEDVMDLLDIIHKLRLKGR